MIFPLVAALFLQGADVAPPFVNGGEGVPHATGATAAVTHYTRVAPNVALSGFVPADAAMGLEKEGIRTLIDLRGERERGVTALEERAGKVGLDYRRMTMPAKAADIVEFLPSLVAVIDDPDLYPILIHCGSSNRAGAAWALYRAYSGVPQSVAIEEGRAGGMTSREEVVLQIFEEGLLPQ